MALAIVQHSNAIHTTQNPPTAVTLAGAPTAGNLLIALMGVNMASYTVNTAGWTQFDASVTSGAQGQANSNLLAFYRYAQAGDTATLPAFLTAGSTYWSHQIWEISGVTGSWNTDFLCSFPLPLTESNASICPLRVYADSLALTGCASYNGAANATISGSWTLDDANHNNANFGSAAGAHRAMVNGNALDGAWSQGTSSPYSAIVLILTTAQPTNGVYPRHVYRCSGTTGFTSTLALPFDPKIGNLLLAYIPYGAAPTPSPTVAAGWTEYSSASNGSGKRFLSLYRYSLSGDKTLPALFSAAGQAQEFMLVEMGGSVSGTFATDHVSNKTGEQDTGTTLTTTADTTTANNQFGVLAYGNFNATVDPTATSFDGYLCKSHDTGYGSFLLMFKYLATSGSTVQSTITPGLTSNVQTYSQDIFNFGAGSGTETGTGTLAFSGLGFAASGVDTWKTVFITSGTTWVVPADFNPYHNAIRALGAGGSGAAGVVSSAAGGSGGSGGYSRADNVALTPGSTVAVQIGAAGGGNASGNDTWLKDNSSVVAVLAQGGGNASGSTGGAASGTSRAVGAGINGGAAGRGGQVAAGRPGAPGAGAAGPSGAGVQGVAAGSTAGAAGGAGGDNGGIGSAGTSTTGGDGGDGGASGTGHGTGATSTTNATAGTSGGGGGGGAPTDTHQDGAAGGSEALWVQTSDSATAGPGGGGGGGAIPTGKPGGKGGAGGNYGGGGAGGGNTSSSGGAGGAGGASILVVRYLAGEWGSATLAFNGLSFAGSGNDHTGSARLTFSGISLTASGTDRHTGTGVLSFSGVSLSARGNDHTGSALLAFSGMSLHGIGSRVERGPVALVFGALTITAVGSDITAPVPPVPPPVVVARPPHVDPLTWNVPIVGKSGAPTQEFMRKFDKQGSINSTVVPQNYIDAQDAAQLAAGQGYTVSYGATVLVAAKAYTDAQPPNALPSYTVATLPAGQAKGKQAIVTDALTPTYLSPVVGGGAVTAPVFYDGTQWVCH